jgi:RNA polymerase sigma-70 factor (ECF subfamily)
MNRRPDELIPTRKSLLSRLKNQDDHDSWTEFFNTYWKLIYGVARRAGLADADAQDVVQETVILVSKKMREFKYDPAGSFKAWLLRATQWRINDQLRRCHRAAARAVVRTDTGTGTSATERIPDPEGFKLEDVWDEEWEKNLFDAAVEKVRRQVNAKQYQIFDLYVIKQRPVGEVARLMGVNVGRVYLAKCRVLALIKKEVKSLQRKEP